MAANSTLVWDATLGAFVSGAAAINPTVTRAAAQSAINMAQANIQAASLAFQQGTISLSAWTAVMEAEIVNMTAAQMVLANGGFANMDAAAWSRAADSANKQLDYFAKFAADVQAKGTFTQADMQRAKMYADSGRATYENERTFVSGSATGATEAMRVLGATDSCVDCLDWAAFGWIPLNDMLNDYPIGASVCIVRCYCTIVTR